MPIRHENLFGRIARFDALYDAWHKAIRGKRAKPGAAAFTVGLETNLLRLERELRNHTWRPGRYVTIEICDPKHRIVSAARSSAKAGSIRLGGGLAVPRLRPARRHLEQQSQERPRGCPQQERHRKPQQQYWLPRGPHAPAPEPPGSRSERARQGCVQGLPW
jgi:hypothetical protein